MSYPGTTLAKVEYYCDLLEHRPILVESLGFRREGDKVIFGPVSWEMGRLIRATSRVREVVHEGKGTGLYETVGDTLVYRPSNRPHVLYTTINCGMFRIFIH